MQERQVAERTAHFRGIERQWAENLYELDEHATYRLLAAGDMAGKTGDEANAMMSEAPLLWGWLGELRAVLDEVDRLSQDRGVFGPKHQETIAGLLTGPSIELRRSEIPKKAPRFVIERLVDSSVDSDIVTLTLETLVVLFRSVYEPVRAVVADVDAVWRDLWPRIDAAEVSLSKAEATCRRLEMTLPEVRHARQRLDAVKSSVSDDPLSLAANVGVALDELVAEAARTAGNLERAHGSVDSDVEATSGILADLRVLRARAAAAYSEAEAKISPSTPLVRVPSTAVIDGPSGLAHRAAQIGGNDQPWQQRRSSLDKWHHAAQRLRTQLERALEVNTSSITERNEMRGLLRAYRQKASMMSQLTDEVTSLGDEVHHELFTSPTDLVRAREMLARYSSALTK